jgi:uncharacterized protein YkwD
VFFVVDAFVFFLVLGLARAGWRRGFTSMAIDLAGFTVALLLALRLHGVPATAFRLVWSDGWAALAGGLSIFVPLIVVTAIVGSRVGRVMLQPGLRMTNKLLGVGFGVAWAAIALTFALLVTQFAPAPLGLSDAVRRSPTAKLVLSAAAPVTRLLQGVAQRDADKIILYLRTFLKPREKAADESEPPLHFPPVRASVLSGGSEHERRLLVLVNAERAKRKLRPLRWDGRLASVGREHSRDMYVRGYFAHRQPDGSTPSRRLENARIESIVSGENLALAPSLALVHDGLMRSPAHRRNILDPGFSKLGVGILAGPYGLMTSQEFCGGC